MTDKPSRPRRPIVGSRTSTSRPRQVAGRAPEPAEPTEPVGPTEPTEPTEPVGATDPVVEPDVVSEQLGRTPAEAVDDGATQTETRPGSRMTVALVVLIVLLTGVAAAESWYLWLREDPVVSSERPVVTSEVATASAVDTAARALQEILATSWKDYADQVDEATTAMTSTFAEEYRKTAEAIADDFVAAKTEVQVEITGQGVVRASSEQVQALVFLTQLVTTDGGELKATPYRALVTVVNTDQGWLVSDIETR